MAPCSVPAWSLPLVPRMQARPAENLTNLTPLPRTLPPRNQLIRLRLHLLFARLARECEDEPSNDSSNNSKNSKSSFSAAECRNRSERLRSLWADAGWRSRMMQKRKESNVQEKQSTAAKKLWQDPAFRQKMRQARLGRPAPNKGVSASAVTRLRMSMARKGNAISESTKRKMSQAKLKRPEGDTWPKLISESKRGKTKEYFAMRRELRALYKDLKLWSDSYRAKYGKLPTANGIEQIVAPMMIFRIKRYLTLRDALGDDEPEVDGEIISRRD